MRSLLAKPHLGVIVLPLAAVADFSSLARMHAIAGKWPCPRGGCAKL